MATVHKGDFDTRGRAWGGKNVRPSHSHRRHEQRMPMGSRMNLFHISNPKITANLLIKCVRKIIMFVFLTQKKITKRAIVKVRSRIDSKTSMDSVQRALQLGAQLAARQRWAGVGAGRLSRASSRTTSSTSTIPRSSLSTIGITTTWGSIHPTVLGRISRSRDPLMMW